MRIQHNIPAMNSYRNLYSTNNSIAKNLEKLSSGYRINRAGDDAAGLAISEKMRFQIAGLTQAVRNAEDGVSLVKTAEGAMTEVHSMLNRMETLAVQAANGTYSKTERSMMNDELSRLKDEIDRIGSYSNFNGIHLFTKKDVSETSGRIASYDLTLDLTGMNVRVNSAVMYGNSGDVALASPTGPNAVLAEKIATEYFPNAISQIFDAFPALETAVGQNTIDMKLHIDYIDGGGNTLAYAQYSYTSTGSAINMLIKVDSSDFSDASIQSGSADVEKLESTIAHELMHSVMQYTMTDEMSGRTGTEFPEWFTEGTAQLAGGGFPTNWNYELEAIAKRLSDAADSGQDTAIADYLKKYGVAERPYGHGYLATAYLGYLASGRADVTGANIAAGMNKIFDEIIKNDKSLYDALSAATGRLINSTADVEALFTNPSQDMVVFVRQLSYAAKGGQNDGAGSVIASSLGAGSDSIIGNTVKNQQAFRVTEYVLSSSQETVIDSLQLMVGAYGKDYDAINIDFYQMDSDAIGLTSANLLTVEDARSAIDLVNAAIDEISSIRGYYGAIQNRLEHTINNLGNAVENITSAESRIRDMDMAKAMMDYTKNQILLQSGQSMLVQANMTPQSILTLLN